MRKAKEDYAQLQNDIQTVKSPQVMEFLKSTEEARLFVEEAMKANDVSNELDPPGEQDKDDCELDFDHLNPDELCILEQKAWT